METKVVVVVCTIAGILGLLSAALGFAAEATKVKGSQISPNVKNEVCIYPSSPAATLGFISALSLLVALIVTNAASGCFCCYTRRNQYPPTPRCQCGWALVCFIFSWLTFVPGFLLMLGAASLSRSANMNKLRTQDNNYSYYYCYYVKQGVFASAACLSFISVLLGIICYLNLNAASRKSGPSAVPTAPGAGNIAMGQPQVPPHPTTHQPTYV